MAGQTYYIRGQDKFKIIYSMFINLNRSESTVSEQFKFMNIE